MALAPAQRDKLARILALLASDQPGEVVAAAHAANRLVKGAGLSWVDVLGSQERRGAATFQPEMSRRHDIHPSPVPDHVADLQVCGRRPDLLTPWETAFVTGLAAQRNPVSAKQRRTLTEIAAKVRAAGPRTA